MASAIRLNFHVNSESAISCSYDINKQINMELNASYVYLAMVSNLFDNNAVLERATIGLVLRYVLWYFCGCRLLYKWTVHGKSPSVTTDPNTVQN